MNEEHMARPKHPSLVLEAIEGQIHTYRYSTVPTLQPRQNVAAHVGRCAQIMVVVIRELFDNASFTGDVAYNLLSRIVIHDLAESLTGDIIWPTKNHVPEIEHYEDSVLDSLGELSLYTGLPLIGNENCVKVQSLVKMVDSAEGAMYSTEEVKLGNHRFMNPLMNYKNNLWGQLLKAEELWGQKFISISVIHRRAEQAYARGLSK